MPPSARGMARTLESEPEGISISASTIIVRSAVPSSETVPSATRPSLA